MMSKKKTLRGFSKTRHFLQRQKQRQVSDHDIVQALQQGSLIENDDGQKFLFGSLQVTVDLNNSTLITVHPGEPSSKQQKLLSPLEAKKISDLIQAREQEQSLKLVPEKIDESDEFLRYVAEFSVKKI